MTRLRHWITWLRGSLWLLPLGMGVVAVVAAGTLLDVRFAPGADSWAGRLLYGGSAESARNLLSGLLTGMITMFSLVLSITMVVLTLAAGQLGPRLIRSFMDDRFTQVVLGLFMATVLYLLLVLRVIDENIYEELPQVAITVGSLLSVVCLFVLLVFIDRLARSIVFDNVARRISAELTLACDALGAAHAAQGAMDQSGAPDSSRSSGRAVDGGGRPLAATDGSSAEDEPARKLGALGEGSTDDAHRQAGLPQGLFDGAATIALGRDGYVQGIAYEALVAAAENAGAVLRLDLRPGHWVNAGTPCVAVAPAAACDDGMRKTVREAFVIGSERTPTQDIQYGLERLVEIALRALSPSMNDAYSATAVIDNLGAAMARIFSVPWPQGVLRDGRGAVRVLRDVDGPMGLMDAAFDQIRQSGATMPAIAIRLLDTLARLAPALNNERQREAVRRHIDAVLASAKVQDMIEKDGGEVTRRHAAARRRIG